MPRPHIFVSFRAIDMKFEPSSNSAAACEQPIRFETTRHGNPIITWGRYRFTKKLQRKEKAWWNCTARRKDGCNCILVTKNDRMVKLNGWHNH
ncbi:FLYWCH zinc finger domain-containing protein [Phthorimaea operculella]|nr:FLYWCH zinc finger domain-containing protein [Phthorimaea operculella]